MMVELHHSTTSSMTAGGLDSPGVISQVPPGRFWESNVVRTCPQGLYREGYVKTDDRAAIACLSCMAGWTTKGIGSTSLLNCTRKFFALQW